MANRALRLDKIGYWSEIKLEIVRKYASAYSVILAKQSFSKGHVYIDAFAGAGTHLSKTSREEVQGSPLIAMQVAPPFTELHFIDLDGSRTAELRRLARMTPAYTFMRATATKCCSKRCSALSLSGLQARPLSARPVWTQRAVGSPQDCR